MQFQCFIGTAPLAVPCILLQPALASRPAAGRAELYQVKAALGHGVIADIAVMCSTNRAQSAHISVRFAVLSVVITPHALHLQSSGQPSAGECCEHAY